MLIRKQKNGAKISRLLRNHNCSSAGTIPELPYSGIRQPWIKVNPNFRKINVEDQLKDKTSILNYYRDLIKLRKKYPALVYGDYEVIDEDNPSVYAYRRIGKEASFLVILSFSENPASFKIPEDLNASRSVIFNYSDSPEVRGSSVSLRPYEAVVFKID